MADALEDREQAAAYHARKLLEIGVELLTEGLIAQAMETFEESLAICPTAEGYTYRGWARSHNGDHIHAIEDCRKAIRLDPDLGNPYNDIGVYLMHLGRLDEAEQWLERAKTAKRYEPRHFPHLNLGHIYSVQGRDHEALMEYVRALELQPENEIAKKALADLDLSLLGV